MRAPAYPIRLLDPVAPLSRDVLAQETGASAPVAVTSGDALRTERPASAGPLLDLAPRQTRASIDVIERARRESRGDLSLVDAVAPATGTRSLAHPGDSGSLLSVCRVTDTLSVVRPCRCTLDSTADRRIVAGGRRVEPALHDCF